MGLVRGFGGRSRGEAEAVKGVGGAFRCASSETLDRSISQRLDLNVTLQPSTPDIRCA
jgi:hypothetical protein